MSPATVALDEKLILEIHQYPNVLNKQLDRYKNRNAKHRIRWKTVLREKAI